MINFYEFPHFISVKHTATEIAKEKNVKFITIIFCIVVLCCYSLLTWLAWIVLFDNGSFMQIGGDVLFCSLYFMYFVVCGLWRTLTPFPIFHFVLFSSFWFYGYILWFPCTKYEYVKINIEAKKNVKKLNSSSVNSRTCMQII